MERNQIQKMDNINTLTKEQIKKLVDGALKNTKDAHENFTNGSFSKRLSGLLYGYIHNMDGIKFGYRKEINSDTEKRINIRKLEGNQEDKDGFDLVYLREQPRGIITPHCKIHGAMNCIITSNGDKLWRCYSEYGYGKLKEGQTVPRVIDRVCNACCISEDDK